ncbi:MAG: hypothetical protein Q4F31_04565 [Eubacteriales bacterium]|nr:hypothetical protein [Eubacteriales bacterium]
MSEEKDLSSGTDNQIVPDVATGKDGKSAEQEKFANLHPLRARLYDNVNLSLRTMDIVVAVVAIALLVVFFVGVATGSGVNLN